MGKYERKNKTLLLVSSEDKMKTVKEGSWLETLGYRVIYTFTDYEKEMAQDDKQYEVVYDKIIECDAIVFLTFNRNEIMPYILDHAFELGLEIWIPDDVTLDHIVDSIDASIILKLNQDVDMYSIYRFIKGDRNTYFGYIDETKYSEVRIVDKYSDSVISIPMKVKPGMPNPNNGRPYTKESFIKCVSDTQCISMCTYLQFMDSYDRTKTKPSSIYKIYVDKTIGTVVAVSEECVYARLYDKEELKKIMKESCFPAEPIYALKNNCKAYMKYTIHNSDPNSEKDTIVTIGGWDIYYDNPVTRRIMGNDRISFEVKRILDANFDEEQLENLYRGIVDEFMEIREVEKAND